MMRWGPLVFVLALGACASSQPARPTAPALPRPSPDDLLSVVPVGADFVLDVDVATLRAWPLGDRIFDLARIERARVAADLGFDPIDQVDQVVIAVQGGATGASRTITALARGTFDVNKLMPEGASVEDYRGVKVRRTRLGASAVLGPHTIVSGHLAGVRGAIDTLSGVLPGIRTDRELIELLDAVPASQAPDRHTALRLASRRSAWMQDGSLSSLAISEARRVAVRVAAGDSLEVHILEWFGKPDDARTAAQQIRGELGDVLQNLRPFGLAGLGRALAVQQAGDTLELAFVAPNTAVDRFVRVGLILRAQLHAPRSTD
jgi:hypothetical protein